MNIRFLLTTFFIGSLVFEFYTSGLNDAQGVKNAKGKVMKKNAIAAKQHGGSGNAASKSSKAKQPGGSGKANGKIVGNSSSVSSGKAKAKATGATLSANAGNVASKSSKAKQPSNIDNAKAKTSSTKSSVSSGKAKAKQYGGSDKANGKIVGNSSSVSSDKPKGKATGATLLKKKTGKQPQIVEKKSESNTTSRNKSVKATAVNMGYSKEPIVIKRPNNVSNGSLLPPTGSQIVTSTASQKPIQASSTTAQLSKEMSSGDHAVSSPRKVGFTLKELDGPGGQFVSSQNASVSEKSPSQTSVKSAPTGVTSQSSSTTSSSPTSALISDVSNGLTSMSEKLKQMQEKVKELPRINLEKSEMVKLGLREKTQELREQRISQESFDLGKHYASSELVDKVQKNEAQIEALAKQLGDTKNLLKEAKIELKRMEVKESGVELKLNRAKLEFSKLERKKQELETKQLEVSMEAEKLKFEKEAIQTNVEKEVQATAQAQDLLLFFGSGKEESRLNFNAMNAEQQNAVLDKAIDLATQINNTSTIGEFFDSIKGFKLLNADSLRLVSRSDIDLAQQKAILTDALKQLRESKRTIDAGLLDSIWSCITGSEQKIYNKDGNLIVGGSTQLTDQLISYFNLSGLSSGDLLNFDAAMFDMRQSIFVILEKLQIRESFIKENYDYYGKHITDLRKLLSLEHISDIGELHSGHALYVLLESMNDPKTILTIEENSKLRRLLGTEAECNAENISGLLKRLLEESCSINSKVVDKLVNEVVTEIKDCMTSMFKDKELSEVFNTEKVSENAQIEAGHVYYIESKAHEASTSSHGNFVSSHRSVLELIRNGGDADGQYSKALMQSAIESGDSAIILHMISLLDPEEHSAIFQKFDELKVSNDAGFDATKLDELIRDIKERKEEYFGNGPVTFKIDNVEDEVDHANKNYEYHEDNEMLKRINVARTNAQNKTTNTAKKDTV